MRCIVGHILGSVSSPSPLSQPRPRSHDSWSQKYVSRPSLFVSHAHSLITSRHHSSPLSPPLSHPHISRPISNAAPRPFTQPETQPSSFSHSSWPQVSCWSSCRVRSGQTGCPSLSVRFGTLCDQSPHSFYTHLAWTHRMANLNPHEPALTFILAPFPNWICSRCASADDLSPEFNSAYIDFGRFLTGMLVVRPPLAPPWIHPSKLYDSREASPLIRNFPCNAWDNIDDRSFPPLATHPLCVDPARCLLDVDCGRYARLRHDTSLRRMVWRR